MSGSTWNTKEGYKSEQDQCSGEHGEGDNQILNILLSSPKRAFFQRYIGCSCVDHKLNTYPAKCIHMSAV